MSGATQFVFLFALLMAGNLAGAQSGNVSQWVNALVLDDDRQSTRLTELATEAKKYDSANCLRVIREMEEQVRGRGDEFLQARFSLFKKLVLNKVYKPEQIKDPMLGEYNRALEIAQRLNKELLLTDVCFFYGGFLNQLRQYDAGAFYNIKAMELMEKLGPEKFSMVGNRYRILGEIQYRNREYADCISNSKKALYNTVEPVGYLQRMIVLNTIGLAYKKMGKADSAITFFDLAAAEYRKDTTRKSDFWITVPQANKAQIWMEQRRYEEARPLFVADLAQSYKVGELANAANNLQLLARIHLAYNQTDSARAKAYRAQSLLQRKPDAVYLANTFETLSQVYMQLNKADSFNRYEQLYNHLHDSLEASAALSRSAVIKLRLADERNRSTIAMLQKEKESERARRNTFVGAVLLIGIILLLLFNRQRARVRQQMQLKEAEYQAAKEQMALFTRSLADKSDLIEQLQQELEQNKLSPQLQHNLESLRQRTILTEEDWIEFQDTFEKLYPGFFKKLRNQSPDITRAEQRFAAIVRLRLTNGQAAAMLGISLASARKSRMRLQQRLQLSETSTLDEFLLSL